VVNTAQTSAAALAEPASASAAAEAAMVQSQEQLAGAGAEALLLAPEVHGAGEGERRGDGGGGSGEGRGVSSVAPPEETVGWGVEVATPLYTLRVRQLQERNAHLEQQVRTTPATSHLIASRRITSHLLGG
jgi:hypothetical protein